MCKISLTFPFLLFLLTCVVYGKKEKKTLNPIVIIPAFLGSPLWATGENIETPDLKCDKSFTDKKIWGNLENIFLHLPCTRNYLSSQFKDGKWTRMEGVKEKKYLDYPSSKNIEKLFHFSVYGDMISFFKKKGYEDNKTLFASGYDWSELPSDEWVRKTQVLIEDAVKNTKKKVVLISHSMGCPISYYFLNEMRKKNENWVENHIHMYIPIAPAWAGSIRILKEMFNFNIPKFIFDMIVDKRRKISSVNRFSRFDSVNNEIGLSQEHDDKPYLSRNYDAAMMIRHLPTAWMLLPWKEAFENEILASNNVTGESYYFSQLVSFMQSILTDNSDVGAMLSETQIKFKHAINGYQWRPPVPIRIIYGRGVETPVRIKVGEGWEQRDFEDRHALWKEISVEEDFNGDGTVHEESLSYAGRIWENTNYNNNNNNNSNVLTWTFWGKGVEHTEILKHEEVIQNIYEAIIN